VRPGMGFSPGGGNVVSGPGLDVGQLKNGIIGPLFTACSVGCSAFGSIIGKILLL
jgi:hypothetical protein